jgi:hypothetical protein
MTKEQFNYFEFKHVDGNTTVTNTIQAMFVGDVIDQFVCFLHGCGHYNKAIYEHMCSISEQYFDVEEKRNLELLNKFNLPKPNLDIGLE